MARAVVCVGENPGARKIGPFFEKKMSPDLTMRSKGGESRFWSAYGRSGALRRLFHVFCKIEAHRPARWRACFAEISPLEKLVFHFFPDFFGPVPFLR